MPSNYMKPEMVDAAVKAAGTQFATVEFVKVNGDVRRITGLFNTTKNMANNELSEAARQKNKAANLIPIAEAKLLREGAGKKSWRSFKRDRVISIKVAGHTY